jgi:hypothetical protein
MLMSGDRFIMDTEDSAPSHPLQATRPYAPSPSTELPSRTTPTPARTQQGKITISRCTSSSTRTIHGRQLQPHRHENRLHRFCDKVARAPTTLARCPSSSRATRPRHIKPPWVHAHLSHYKIYIAKFIQHRHQATLPRDDIKVYSDNHINPLHQHRPSTDEAKPLHQHVFSSMKQTISCRAPSRRRQDIKFDTDKVDTTRPCTDEAKATHLSKLTRPDIFIIGHRQAREYG